MTTFAIALGTFWIGVLLGFFVAAVLAAGKREDAREEKWDV